MLERDREKAQISERFVGKFIQPGSPIELEEEIRRELGLSSLEYREEIWENVSQGHLEFTPDRKLRDKRQLVLEGFE